MEAVAVQNPPPAIDLKALKTKQQAAWASGDYAVIGTTLQIVGEQLAEVAYPALLHEGARICNKLFRQLSVKGSFHAFTSNRHFCA